MEACPLDTLTPKPLVTQSPEKQFPWHGRAEATLQSVRYSGGRGSLALKGNKK